MSVLINSQHTEYSLHVMQCAIHSTKYKQGDPNDSTAMYCLDYEKKREGVVRYYMNAFCNKSLNIMRVRKIETTAKKKTQKEYYHEESIKNFDENCDGDETFNFVKAIVKALTLGDGAVL